MALSITVNGGGTFSASMEEGPVSFTASLGAVPGPKGDTGATGPTGVIAATAPILYNSGTQTVSIDTDPEFISVTTGSTSMSTAGVQFPDSVLQTTAFVGEARKEYVIARNNTGSTIAAGKVVYLSGATGNKPTVALALADSEATSARTIGITVESIANNADGKVVISGAAENIDTSAFSAGDTLYLSATTAGAMTTTLPAAPLHGVVIGIVTRANPSVGSIEVAINNYQELKELSDVSVADRANNDGLFWEASSTTWRSKTIAEVLGLTPIALTSLSASAPIAYNSGTGAFTFDSSTFLLKADNLSGLASASTARTNLGLGTMATETASNYLTTAAASSTYLTQSNAASTYAPLASPAFTGNPTAPTPATNDNNGSIATTAFVNAYAPAASTTTAGKVELATDAEAIIGVDTSRAITPKNLFSSLINRSLRFYTGTDLASPSTTNGGTTATANGVEVSTSATTSGAFAMRGVASSNQHPQSLGKGRGVLSFAKPTWIGTRIQRQTTLDANAVIRLSVGKIFADSKGDLTRKGFGWVIQGSGNFQTQGHNGTSLTKSTNGTTGLADTNAVDVLCYSDGAGNVKLYVNGVETASSTGGPTGDSGSTANAIIFEIEQVGTATAVSAADCGQIFIIQID